MGTLRRLLLNGFCLATMALGTPWAIAAPKSPGTWQQIDNPPPVVGMDGKGHAAQCSGYPGTDPKFKFWARKGSSKNLVVYFEGGGACWDNLTCTLPIAGLPPQVPQFPRSVRRSNSGRTASSTPGTRCSRALPRTSSASSSRDGSRSSTGTTRTSPPCRNATRGGIARSTTRRLELT